MGDLLHEEAAMFRAATARSLEEVRAILVDERRQHAAMAKAHRTLSNVRPALPQPPTLSQLKVGAFCGGGGVRCFLWQNSASQVLRLC